MIKNSNYNVNDNFGDKDGNNENTFDENDESRIMSHFSVSTLPINEVKAFFLTD